MATTKKTIIRSRKTEKTAAKSTRRLVAMTASAPPSSSSSSSSSRVETNNSAAVDSASDYGSATNDGNVTNPNDTTDVEQNAEKASSKDIDKWKSNTGSAKRWRLAQRRLAEQSAKKEAERRTPEEAACAESVRLARQNRSAELHLKEMVEFWKTQPEVEVKVVNLKTSEPAAKREKK
ncbi:hypothetical protein N0V85_000820 [Neurospora sp. IMI 360204]|nr:hypothetical protein N0V85_000820 [Neurospora sp. IMI 360204]